MVIFWNNIPLFWRHIKNISTFTYEYFLLLLLQSGKAAAAAAAANQKTEDETFKIENIKMESLIELEDFPGR